MHPEVTSDLQFDEIMYYKRKKLTLLNSAKRETVSRLKKCSSQLYHIFFESLSTRALRGDLLLVSWFLIALIWVHGSELVKRFHCVRFKSTNDKKILSLRSIICEKKHSDLSDVLIHLLRLVFNFLFQAGWFFCFVFHLFFFLILETASLLNCLPTWNVNYQQGSSCSFIL